MPIRIRSCGLEAKEKFLCVLDDQLLKRVTITIAQCAAVFQYGNFERTTLQVGNRRDGLCRMHPLIVFNYFRAVLLAAFISWIIENAHDTCISISKGLGIGNHLRQGGGATIFPVTTMLDSAFIVTTIKVIFKFQPHQLLFLRWFWSELRDHPLYLFVPPN